MRTPQARPSLGLAWLLGPRGQLVSGRASSPRPLLGTPGRPPCVCFPPAQPSREERRGLALGEPSCGPGTSLHLPGDAARPLELPWGRGHPAIGPVPRLRSAPGQAGKKVPRQQGPQPRPTPAHPHLDGPRLCGSHGGWAGCGRAPGRGAGAPRDCGTLPSLSPPAHSSRGGGGARAALSLPLSSFD